MNKDELNTNLESIKTGEQDDLKYPFEQPPKRSSVPMVAGILLIIAGVIGILFWVQIFFIDVNTLESTIDISQFQQMDPSITPERLIGFLNTCAIIGCIVAVFPILGGIFALKRKMWGIALAGSIIGLFSIGMLLLSSGFSLIGLILLIVSRKEFQ